MKRPCINIGHICKVTSNFSAIWQNIRKLQNPRNFSGLGRVEDVDCRQNRGDFRNQHIKTQQKSQISNKFEIKSAKGVTLLNMGPSSSSAARGGGDVGEISPHGPGGPFAGRERESRGPLKQVRGPPGAGQGPLDQVRGSLEQVRGPMEQVRRPLEQVRP